MLSIRYFLFFAFVAILFCTSCKSSIDDIASSEHYSLRVLLESNLELQTKATNGESRVDNLYCFVFNEKGVLESLQVREDAPTEITFPKLSAGKKTLFLLANIKKSDYYITPYQLEEITTLSELRALELSHAKVLVATSQPLPMSHSRELLLPLKNPSICVDLTREVARLVVDNDLYTDQIATIDSISFSGLNKRSSLFEPNEKSMASDSITVVLSAENTLHPFYLLPALAEKIRYTVFWKDKLGVTQLIKGLIKPKLDKNNSYRLKLSTGEITDSGVPSHLEVDIDSSTGNYTAVDTTVYISPNGGSFTVSSSSYDNIVCNYSDIWLKDAIETRAIKKDFEFPVSVERFLDSDEMRIGYLTLSNSFDQSKQIRVRVMQQGENRGPKYYIVAVSGQSNASGSDKSPYNSKYDAPSPRVFQLGQSALGDPPYQWRFTSESTLDVMPLRYISQNEDTQRVPTAKGMHLSLGKQILPHIPEDYNVLVVSVSYTGCGFMIADSEGDYDPVEMRALHFPTYLPNRYKLVPGKGLLFNMLADRVKYALKLNKRNRFVGVVWSQGEVDTNIPEADPSKAYTIFEEYAEAFFDKLNKDIDRSQLPRAFAGKHLWYSIDCVPVRKDWHRDVSTQYATGQYFGGYKVWNPDTYIDTPMDVKMNVDITDDGHFGQDAFPETIVPRIVDRMLSNGVFGANTSGNNNAYKRVISRQEIELKMGNVNDVDIQQNLLVCLPFSEEDSLTTNLSKKDVPAVIRNLGCSLSAAIDLPYLNAKQRKSRLALSLSKASAGTVIIENKEITSAGSWTASFMLRRTDGQNNSRDAYLLRVPATAIGLFYHRYGIENEGGYLGLAFQPSSPTFQRKASVLARLGDAAFVRSYGEWVHYSVSYNHENRECRMYLNGQLTMSKTLPSAVSAPDISLLQIGDSVEGIEGQLVDFYVWDREVSVQTLFKVYLMSYYGVTNPKPKN